MRRPRLPYPAVPCVWISLALGLALGVACHDGSHTVSSSFVSIDSEGGGEITINGVAWKFDGTVHYVYHSESSSLSGSKTTMTVDGHAFGLRDDTLFIGDREYGTAADGALVKVSSEGLTVDGEMRGPLP